MTFSQPEENTLGAIVGNARRRVTNTARRIGRASAHRGTLGTAFLGLGAAIIVGLRAVYGIGWFAALWGSYPLPAFAVAAWLVLIAVIVLAVVALRAIGDQLPDWMFAVFLFGVAAATALDITAVWDLHDIGRNAQAGLAAGMALLLLVAQRGRAELVVSTSVLGVGIAIAMFLDAPTDRPVDAAWIAPRSPASRSPCSPRSSAWWWWRPSGGSCSSNSTGCSCRAPCRRRASRSACSHPRSWPVSISPPRSCWSRSPTARSCCR
ncbi:hypothetical protein GCM10025881_05610 [Pseudolysinimonas kribbensis]|uniref:Uncharacterized protein n=1 Tax=Pseudolysinimonas kribbensis TaxID=433641 RepID=A0ABQ6K4E6_9MICO|nr:hypothetical protein [Pseudolysinimonas kribbensis]GMA93737.1 hypothetical protein GCM10025881_05610 [Pseudolysinimonas kribbensis]